MTRSDPPPLWALVRVFWRIGILSFGGPAAQIALMHRELVELRPWLTEQTFLRALSLCMLLPGPEAMQLATYAGWRLRGTSGGLVAGLLFVVPGAFVILGLAFCYVAYGDLPLVKAAFDGIKAAVIVIVLQALVNLSRKALVDRLSWALAGAGFAALFLFNLPFPVVIGAAALIGALAARTTLASAPDTSGPPPRPVQVIVLWGALWAIPIGLLALIESDFLLQIALFFSKLAVVTFGGAYAVLAYMTQTVVSDFGWITTEQMIDALGLAETTPGPLILVTQFVALLAGYVQGGPVLALAAGATALWVTFVPCFLWIFLAAPYLERIASLPRLSAALRAITATVVGVILNLAVWFGVHVLFGAFHPAAWIATPLPDLSSLRPDAMILTLLSALLILWLKRGIAQTLVLMALAGIALASF